MDGGRCSSCRTRAANHSRILLRRTNREREGTDEVWHVDEGVLGYVGTWTRRALILSTCKLATYCWFLSLSLKGIAF